MGKTYPAIDDRLRKFIESQYVFFVATAPETGGHINLSPKGLDAFRVLDPTTVAYLDYVGSGAETIAHLRQNGRIVIMFCAFEGPPQIVRLHGTGRAVEPGDVDFSALMQQFRPTPGMRSVIRVSLDRISDSCGYGVPLYRYEGDRNQLHLWAENKQAAGLAEYQKQKNSQSIDGLPALRWTSNDTGKGS